VILNRDRLVGILNILGTAVGNKIMKVADYVQFRLNRETRRLLVSTTDFNAFLTVDYGDLALANVDDFPEHFLVEYRLLSAILKASTTADVDIRQDKINGPIVVVTNGKYELPRYADPSEFPVNDYAHNVIGRCDASALQHPWAKAVVAVSKDVTKISYQGVNFDGNFAATDNRRLSVANTPIAYTGDSILLMPLFGGILEYCHGDVTLGLSTNAKQVVIICEDINLIASVRLIDAKFVPYKNFLSTKQQGVLITIPKQEFIGVINRLMILTDQVYKSLNIEITKKDDKVELHLSISNRAEGSETITASSFKMPGDLEDMGDGVIAKYSYQVNNFLDGAIVTQSPDSVVCNVQSDGKLWIEEEGFTYLITCIQQ